MKTSEAVDKIVPALFDVQAKLRRVAPTAKNEMLRSRYAPLADVWESVLPTLQEAGLLVTWFPEGGVPTTIECVIFHVASMQWVSSALTLESGENKGTSYAQKTGANITYARRYLLTAMLGIVIGDEEDDGAGNGRADWGSKERRFGEMLKEIAACKTSDDLRGWWKKSTEERAILDPDRAKQVTDQVSVKAQSLEVPKDAAPEAPRAESKPEPAPKAEPKPKKKAEPKEEPKPAPIPKLEPKVEPKPEPKLEPEPPSGGDTGDNWGDLFGK